MQISASQLPLVHAVGASGARRARAAAAAAPLGLKPLQLSSRTAQTARGASAISLEGRVRRSSKATAASRVVTTSSLEGVFKQSKESLQWVTIFLTFGSIVAVAAPMASLSAPRKPSHRAPVCSLSWIHRFQMFKTQDSSPPLGLSQAVMGKASLLTVSTIALGGAGLWLFVEVGTAVNVSRRSGSGAGGVDCESTNSLVRDMHVSN